MNHGIMESWRSWKDDRASGSGQRHDDQQTPPPLMQLPLLSLMEFLICSSSLIEFLGPPLIVHPALNIHCSPVIQRCAPRPISDGRLPNRNPGTCPFPGTAGVAEGLVCVGKRGRSGLQTVEIERWSLRFHVAHAPPCTIAYSNWGKYSRPF